MLLTITLHYTSSTTSNTIFHKGEFTQSPRSDHVYGKEPKNYFWSSLLSIYPLFCIDVKFGLFSEKYSLR